MGGFIDVGDTAAQLAKLGADLKEAADVELKKEMLKAGRDIAVPVKETVKIHALTDLPKRGGLNVWVASRLRFSVQTRLTGSRVGVRILIRRPSSRAGKGYSDLPAINAGRVRHPVFGDRGAWATTTVEPGFVDRAVDERIDTFRKTLLDAVRVVAAKLAAKG